MSQEDQLNMRQKLELHIHEQYAINDNAKMSSLITLFVPLLTAVGFYGYVFVHSTCEFSKFDGKWELIDPNKMFNLDALILTAFCSLFILFVLSLVCLELGFSHRYTQFIIHAIRAKYYQPRQDNKEQAKSNSDKGVDEEIDLGPDFNQIFPRGWTPFGKDKKKVIDVVPGLYGEFIKYLKWTGLIIIISCLAKVVFYWLDSITQYPAFIEVPIVVLGGLWMRGYFRFFFCRKIRKYKGLEHEYQEKLKQSKQKENCGKSSTDDIPFRKIICLTLCPCCLDSCVKAYLKKAQEIEKESANAASKSVETDDASNPSS